MLTTTTSPARVHKGWMESSERKEPKTVWQSYDLVCASIHQSEAGHDDGNR
jgi:hypothetical protein